MKLLYVPRFLLVSTINYFFGNFLFAALWLLLNKHFTYFEIALCCTFFASIFSYQMQMRFILGFHDLKTILNIRYLVIQLVGLISGSIIVPKLAESISANIILVQFVWSGIFSLGSILFLFFVGKKREK